MHDILGPFTVRSEGEVGQTILDLEGKVIAWTTDPWVAQVVCRLLTDNQQLLEKE